MEDRAHDAANGRFDECFRCEVLVVAREIVLARSKLAPAELERLRCALVHGWLEPPLCVLDGSRPSTAFVADYSPRRGMCG